MPDDDLFVFVLENAETGEVRGTCQMFSRVGHDRPFYSYRISTLTQNSPGARPHLPRRDADACAPISKAAREVGGLFLHPGERAGGLGLLLARSRYLFITLHRARFADRILAELRGVIDEAGGSPFWDAIAGRFFGMSFQEADEFNAIHGNQFIADLMPKHADLHRDAARKRARGDAACRTRPAARRCGCSSTKASRAKAMSTFSTAARP